MRTGRTLRSIAVLASVALVMGAFVAGPAAAKKKKKKPPVVPVCATYTPTSWGAEQPITLVTDANTAEAPLTMEIETAEGVGSSGSASPDDGQGTTSHAFVNVQIDSAAPTTGLYATVHYTPVWDYDLWVRGDDGAGIAYSAGAAEGVPELDGTGNGGHTGTGTENVEGLTTNDCQGYLVDIAGATTPGETVTLDLWLGEATYTPGA